MKAVAQGQSAGIHRILRRAWEARRAGRLCVPIMSSMQVKPTAVLADDASESVVSPGSESVEIDDGPWYPKVRRGLSVWLARGRKGPDGGGTVGGPGVTVPCDTGRHDATQKGRRNPYRTA